MKKIFNMREAFAICIGLHKIIPRKEAERILKKVFAHTEPSLYLPGRGRPHSSPEESVDVMHAKVVHRIMEDHEDIKSLSEALEFAQMCTKFRRLILKDDSPLRRALGAQGEEMADTIRSEASTASPSVASLFPDDRDLRRSVSRGRKSLEIY